jgi:hypothetical protein
MLFCDFPASANSQTRIPWRPSRTHPLELLQNARVQILGHVPVFESILSCLLCRRHRRVKLAELVGEAHADFEWVGHGVVVVGWICLLCLLRGTECLFVEIEEHREQSMFQVPMVVDGWRKEVKCPVLLWGGVRRFHLTWEGWACGGKIMLMYVEICPVFHARSSPPCDTVIFCCLYCMYQGTAALCEAALLPGSWRLELCRRLGCSTSRLAHSSRR